MWHLVLDGTEKFHSELKGQLELSAVRDDFSETFKIGRKPLDG